MSDFSRAIDVETAQLKEKSRAQLMAAVIRAAREVGYTNVAVQFQEEGRFRDLGCPRSRVFIDNEKETMHLGAHSETVNITDVSMISFFDSNRIAKEHFKVEWDESDGGEMRLNLEKTTDVQGIVRFDVTPDSHFVLDQRPPPFEDVQLVSFKFAEWDPSSHARHKCTIFVHGRERGCCAGSSKEEVYRLAVERSLALMKK